VQDKNEILKRAIEQHRAGRLHRALMLYDAVIALDPENEQALQLAGVASTKAQEYERAIEYLQRSAELSPHSAEVLNSLGMALYPAGRHEEAIASFERALSLNPGNAKVANNLGNAHFNRENIEAARSAFETALRIKPDYVEARSNLGHCLVIDGKPEKAVRQFELVLSQHPTYQHAIEGLLSALKALERYEDIVTQRRSLLALEPQGPSRWVELGKSLQAIDRHAEAVDCFRKALEIDPRFAAAHARIGWARMEEGNLKEARDSFAKACKLSPRSCVFRDLLVRVTKVQPGDGTLQALEAMLATEDKLPSTERVHLHFALGKALADVGHDESSFEHYIAANRIERSESRYDEGGILARMDRTGELFSPAVLRASDGGGNRSKWPVFILGMPRTGSTLVEQILAAHPKVVAAGELAAFRDIIQAFGAKRTSQFPEWLQRLTPQDANELGNEYIDRLTRIVLTRNPTTDFSRIERITDKMPGNFLFLGLIHLALPNARFIHTKRDPVETCLSCFRVQFESLNYTNDLAELGRYYRHYAALMEKWKAALPAGLILDVQYEALIDNLEGVARQVIAHCGLEWDDACLAFDRADRPVRTASVAQVRQPIYDTSVRKWRPSDAVLRPLLEGLRPPVD
jgi:tetratricopeptide (TPR) repeat protein